MINSYFSTIGSSSIDVLQAKKAKIQANGINSVFARLTLDSALRTPTSNIRPQVAEVKAPYASPVKAAENVVNKTPESKKAVPDAMPVTKTKDILATSTTLKDCWKCELFPAESESTSKPVNNQTKDSSMTSVSLSGGWIYELPVAEQGTVEKYESITVTTDGEPKSLSDNLEIIVSAPAEELTSAPEFYKPALNVSTVQEGMFEEIIVSAPAEEFISAPEVYKPALNVSTVQEGIFEEIIVSAPAEELTSAPEFYKPEKLSAEIEFKGGFICELYPGMFTKTIFSLNQS